MLRASARDRNSSSSIVPLRRVKSSSSVRTSSSFSALSAPPLSSFSACRRTSDSGVLSSCEASAAKRRTFLNDASSRSNIAFSSCARSEISSLTGGIGMRSLKLSEPMRLAVSRISRTGRSATRDRPKPIAMLMPSISASSAAQTERSPP